MSASPQTPVQPPSGANGETAPHDLFALTDEQILEIEPEVDLRPAVISSEARNLSSPPATDEMAQPKGDSSSPAAPRNDGARQTAANSATEHTPEPPAWLAAQMKDPWSGEQARELWNGVVQARQEAAAYRAVFATPEDAKVLKELYPGGVNEARAAASRAQLLDQIDQAYFGVAGGSPEQISAARSQLAALMLREDPAAFREMVFAGLRALEETEKGSAVSANTSALPRLAQVFASNHSDPDVAPPFRAAPSPPVPAAVTGDAGLKPGATQPLHESQLTSHQSIVAAYTAFEKAANEDLERSVGTAITRTIDQALPVAEPLLAVRENSESQARVPALRERLAAVVRHDVESALKGDRQLGEQIAQILSARRFDNETRAQVVRLIDDRARQLVPVAAKRVINDWTRTTLAAHRSSVGRADAASARREVEPASSPAGLPRAEQSRPASELHRSAARPRSIDYRKLSDEQILDM